MNTTNPIALLVHHSCLHQIELTQLLFDAVWKETGKFLTPSAASNLVQGKKSAPYWLTNYYVDHPPKLADSILDFILPTIDDLEHFILALDKLIAEDPCISPYLKSKMRASYPYHAKDEQIAFMCDCILYTLKRPIYLDPIV